MAEMTLGVIAVTLLRNPGPQTMERHVDRSMARNRRQNFLEQHPPADSIPLHQTLECALKRLRKTHHVSAAAACGVLKWSAGRLREKLKKVHHHSTTWIKRCISQDFFLKTPPFV